MSEINMSKSHSGTGSWWPYAVAGVAAFSAATFFTWTSGMLSRKPKKKRPDTPRPQPPQRDPDCCEDDTNLLCHIGGQFYQFANRDGSITTHQKNDKGEWETIVARGEEVKEIEEANNRVLQKMGAVLSPYLTELSELPPLVTPETEAELEQDSYPPHHTDEEVGSPENTETSQTTEPHPDPSDLPEDSNSETSLP
jgi:hypothetical protein